jgi:hypothetical protein
MKRAGKQLSLNTGLDALVRRLDRKNGGGYTAARIGAAWSKCAGDMALAHTTGAHLRDGTLVIYVDGAIWATELTGMAEQFRVSMNEELGQELVKEIRFTVSRKVARAHQLQAADRETEQFYVEDVVKSVPLTPLERAQIEASVSEIADLELREAVLRATVADLEWKKGLRTRNGR